MDLDDHRLGRMLDSARDAERRGQRPTAVARAQLAKHDCSRLAMRAMPMVTGSWHGNPSASSIPAQTRAAASAPPRLDVFTATPTAQTPALVRLAACRLAYRTGARSGTGQCASPRHHGAPVASPNNRPTA